MRKYFLTDISDLPDWFNIQHYTQAKALDAAGWLTELRYRYGLRESWRRGSYDTALMLFQNAQTNGLVTSASRYRHVNRIEERRHYPEGYTCVTSLMNYFAYGFPSLEQDKAVIQKQVNAIQQAKSLSDDDAFEEWLFTPYDSISNDYSDNNAYLQVHLNTTDEQLKADFADWLTRERAKRAQSLPKRNFNEVDFKSWCDSAVLPYLDLQFWAETEGIRIHQYVMAQAIFPDAYAVGSEVDPIGKLKTTKKKAVYLMRKDILEALGVLFY